MGEDMELPRLFYRLPELAKKWNRSEEDLLHMAATGELELSITHTGSAWTSDGDMVEVEIRDYVQIMPREFKPILAHGMSKCFQTFFARWHGEEVIALEGSESAAGLPSRKFFIPSISYLLVLPEEVARVEEKYPELRSEQSFELERKYPEVVQPPKQDHSLQDQGEEAPIVGRKALCAAFGVKSFNTVRSWAEDAGISLRKIGDPDTVPPTLKPTEIVRIKALRKK